MDFIFLRFIEVWTQGVPCKVNVTPYFARDPLRSYFYEPQKNEIYFLNKWTSDPCQSVLGFSLMAQFTCTTVLILRLPWSASHLPLPIIHLIWYLCKWPSVFIFLTYICLMDLSILIICMSPFRILGVSGVLYHFYLILDRKYFKQTVQTLIKRRVLQRLIWVYTVCLGPKKGHQANMG